MQDVCPIPAAQGSLGENRTLQMLKCLPPFIVALVFGVESGSQGIIAPAQTEAAQGISWSCPESTLFVQFSEVKDSP